MQFTTCVKYCSRARIIYRKSSISATFNGTTMGFLDSPHAEHSSHPGAVGEGKGRDGWCHMAAGGTRGTPVRTSCWGGRSGRRWLCRSSIQGPATHICPWFWSLKHRRQRKVQCFLCYLMHCYYTLTRKNIYPKTTKLIQNIEKRLSLNALLS